MNILSITVRNTIITYSQFIEKANVFKANLFKDPELRKAGSLQRLLFSILILNSFDNKRVSLM